MLCLLLSLVACGGSKTASDGNAVKRNAAPSADYGYSEKNPIKVGGINDGPKNERAYLNRLTGLNGEKVTYERKGSCCMFETANSPYGGGMLDKYEVTIEGSSEKKILYLNMYDEGKLYAPKGFILK
jgi:hypothetical protein